MLKTISLTDHLTAACRIHHRIHQHQLDAPLLGLQEHRSKAVYPLRTASFIVLPSYVGSSDALLKYIAIAVMISIES
jgi:hypothetical protein